VSKEEKGVCASCTRFLFYLQRDYLDTVLRISKSSRIGLFYDKNKHKILASLAHCERVA